MTQVAAAFFSEAGQHIDQLDPATAQFRQAKRIEEAFTGGVGFLKTFPGSEHIRSLATDLWDICHHKHVSLALGPPVTTFTFAAFSRGGVLQALMLPPMNWAEMIEANPVLQLGAIVMVGSQAVDFYNDLLKTDIEGVKKRARAYEAELLRSFQHTPLDDYQKKLLKEFPNGIEPDLMYARKTVIGPN